MLKKTINDVKTLLNGEWNNPEFIIAFRSSQLKVDAPDPDGIICIHKKETRQDFGFNYRVTLNDGSPYLNIITKGTARNFFFPMYIKELAGEPENKLSLVFNLGSELTFDKINC